MRPALRERRPWRRQLRTLNLPAAKPAAQPNSPPAAAAIPIDASGWLAEYTVLAPMLIGVENHFQPEKLWVCVRGGERRGVTQEECEDCPHWQAMPIGKESH